MDSIATSFNKEQINTCTTECFKSSRHTFITPQERSCFSQCTKSIDRRSTRELLDLSQNWSSRKSSSSSSD